MSLFPLIQSEFYKMLSILFVYLYLVIALVLSSDFILDIVFTLTISFTIHNIINKECYYYSKISEYNIFVWLKMIIIDIISF